MTEHLLSGSGGGGGGKGQAQQQAFYSPSTAKDSLNSTAYANVVDVLCEGEIEGLVDGERSIYINNTPLYGDAYNFQGVQVAYRYGTQNQAFIPGEVTNPTNTGESIYNEVEVNQKIDHDFPIVRTITDENVNAVRVTISFPALQQQQSNGDIVGCSVELKASIQSAGGGYTVAFQDTVTGRTGDAYQRAYLINLPSNAVFPINIKLERVTADSTSVSVVDAFQWTSYTEITYARLRYPNTAYVAMRLDAAQFNSIPQRSYLIKGLKVRIPSNATVEPNTGALLYSGIWDGTFKAATYTNDPAWCLYDLLTSRRYGFGDFILTDAEKASFTGSAANLDKYAFYAASQYCSALNTRSGSTNDYGVTGKHGVPDGMGNYEPRFSCNVNIQQPTEAYELINQMASVFRAMPFWQAGSVTVAQDAPSAPVYLFTNANVTEDGGFSYVGSSQKTRANVVLAKYFDIERRDYLYESVEDRASIAKYGVTQKTIEAFACTSRGQARRLAEWMLYSENRDTEVVNFTTSMDAGTVVRPGSIIAISDSLRAGYRRGGRIVSATTSAVTLDSGVAYSPGGVLSVIDTDGKVQARNVASVSGNLLTLTTPFTSAPQANSIWTYETSDLQASQWRVISVTEQDGINYQISALSYNSSRYDYIERGVPLTTRDVSNLNILPAPPTNFQATEALYKIANIVKAKVIITFTPVAGAQKYQVEWRKDYGNWQIANVFGPSYEVLDITPGFFEFKVSSLGADNRLCIAPLLGSITALGKTAPPSDVQNFTYSIDPSLGAKLIWDAVPDIDLATYEIRRGSPWESATLVTTVTATTYTLGILDPGNYTYAIKAKDTSGVYSTNVASLQIVFSYPNPTTVTPTLDDPYVRLDWTQPAVTTYAIKDYIVSYGDTYATSIQLAVTTNRYYRDKATWSGTRTYWVAVRDINNRTNVSPTSATYTITAAPAPTLSGSFYGRNYTLKWNAVRGTLATAKYDIRYGSSYASGTAVTTVAANSLSADIAASWTGTRVFWVAALDGNGTAGAASSISVEIVKAPAPTVTSSISGANVTISWTAVRGTLETINYEVRMGTTTGTFASATKLTTINALTYTTKVTWTGTKRFWVVAIDANGAYATPG